MSYRHSLNIQSINEGLAISTISQNALDKQQDFLKDIISALIGTGTALLVFYLKILWDRNKDRKKVKRKIITELDISLIW